ncbi:spermatogenesis associated 6-like protein isoform X2 [Stomoxys calcitrans]|uniref:spermatogenesis associated 6-like protein isoform X2 n=1 Tax=Stomoxys calcitrans TaxID=35570 RepID=UPI0027E37571|nr:spermatogenesis associated 6-like protein isoform X2 [Stomoxys calcitrans]
MNCQRFHVKIDIKLHAVTCPGVWLCSHGYLEVTLKTLGYFFRTGAIEPYFPILCHDHYKMEGYFKNTPSIASLIGQLQTEPLEITLWQSGRRLGYYQGVLMDLLQMTEPKLHCPHVNTKQLLMKTTTAFPGIIAPKVELCADFFIKDKILNMNNINEELKSFTSVQRKPLSYTPTKTMKHFCDNRPQFYQRPCIINPEPFEELAANAPRKQRTVCHARGFPGKSTKPFEPLVKSNSRRVSIVSTRLHVPD